MKYMVLLLTVSASACAASLGEPADETLDQPFAQWSDINRADENLASQFREKRSHTQIPTRREVGIPRYPDSQLLLGGGFACGNRYSDVTLVSRANIADIGKWYKSRLAEFTAIEVEQELWFIEGIDVSDYQKDSFVVLHHRYVVVKPMGGSLSRIAPDYSSIITIQFDPRLCDKSGEK